MSLEVYKFEPGECTCVLGDPAAGSIRVPVRKLSGTEVVLDPAANSLRENQYVYTKIILTGGPTLSLPGLVLTSASGGVLIQWMHAGPREADNLDRLLREHHKNRAIEKGRAAQSEVKAERTAEPAAPKATAAPPQSPPGLPTTDVRPPTSVPAPSIHPTSDIRHPTFPPPPSVPTDGTSLDVGASLRKKAKTVRARDLASRLETVKVFNVQMIKELIKEAVEEATKLLGSALIEKEKERLLSEAEESFRERLEALQAERKSFEERTRILQEQHERAQRLLEEERRREVSSRQFTISDAGIVELELKLGRILDRALLKGEVSGDLEREMRAIVARLLDDEREKIRAQAEEAQSERISLLEKKVQRLSASLESAVSERDEARELAQSLEATGIPIHNVKKPGLDGKDPNKEKKLSLLKEIIDGNREVRRVLEASGRLPTRIQNPEPAGAATASAPAMEAPTSPTEASPPQTPATASAPKAPERKEAKESALEPIPVLATGTEVDPDDLPWEPPKEKKEPSTMQIRRLRLTQ